MIQHWLTDSASIHLWYCFPKQMHASSVTLWQVVLIFMWFVLSSSSFHYHMPYIHKEYDFVFISRMFNSHRFIRCAPFWFINPLEYLPVQFSFRLLLWLATLTFTSRFLLAIYLLIFKPSVLNFCRNSVFIFLSS